MSETKKPGWISLAVIGVITLGLGGLIGWQTSGRMDYYQELIKPSFAPPGWIFPIAWTLLYAAMSVAAWLIQRSEAKYKWLLLTLYFFQLVVNLLWPVIFFVQQALGLAFIWLVFLWGLILLMMVLYFKHSQIAGWLLVPYLAWVTFAGVLNFMLARMNP